MYEQLVGEAGFEPATSRSQTVRAAAALLSERHIIIVLLTITRQPKRPRPVSCRLSLASRV